jgi:glycosyltransferase involved in cell wall biosynthesis
MKKIKVLRIITRLNIGGPTIHAVLLNAIMDQEVYESYLVTGNIESNESSMDYYADKYGIKPIYVNSMSREIRLFKDLKAFFKIYKIIKKIKPDIVHTHTAKAGILGRLAAWMANVHVIFHTFHGNVFNGYFGKIKTMYFILIEKLLAKLSTKIIAISQQQKKELINLGITKEDKITVINLGFQFENVIPDEKDRNKFREEYFVPNDAKLIGIVGRIVPIKNHKLFLDIAKQVISKYSNVYFAIIGDGELRDDIEKEIIALNLNKRVFITGFIKNLKSIYADLDIVLLTSNNEGTPVALIEAMACKKLVMSTRVGGVEDFIENGVDGFYFPKERYESFTSEIDNWMNNEEKYDQMKSDAQKKAIEKFSYVHLINNMENLYNNYYKGGNK